MWQCTLSKLYRLSNLRCGNGHSDLNLVHCLELRSRDKLQFIYREKQKQVLVHNNKQNVGMF